MFEKWVPSFPIRQPDQIVSIKVKMNSFSPSYEREKQIKINWLLSNEYQRIWFSEKAKYDLLNYPIKDTKRQRMENSSPPFVMKKRPTITGKVMVNRTRPPYRPELND
ncbi:uncharacterized protein LOC123291057 [Chrysoperla carnea]|uniref:uncharacterized protein LOC123291057 n=1 Tax=Chrysoperla carnea TaxID=189513 RepID=UPI001D095045|nr:uncharacterized protein LOC123291057 [Chrysoperla carnea]